jgi:hypothetical protein
VRLLNREKLRGYLGAISATDFILQIPADSQLEKRNVAFDEVKSIKVIRRRCANSAHDKPHPFLPFEIAGVILRLIFLRAAVGGGE